MLPTKRNKIITVLAVTIIAVIIGLTSIAPQLLIWNYLGNNELTYFYKQYSAFKDELKAYIGYAQEIYEGNGLSSEMTLPAGAPSFQPLLPLYIATLFLSLFGGDTNTSFLALNFVFMALLTAMLFLVGRSVLKLNFWWSAILAIILASTPLTTNPETIFNFSNLKHKFVNYFYPLVQTPIPTPAGLEIIDPLITYPAFILAVWALYLFWKNPKISTALTAGVINGLMIHIYFFKWVYLVVWIGLLTTYFIFKFRKEKNKLMAVGLLILLLVLFFVPFLIRYIEFTQNDLSQEYMWRLTFTEYGHHIRIAVYKEYLLYAGLGVAVFWSFRNKDRNKMIFYSAAILGMFIVWNIQLVTGFVPDPRHWFATVNPVVFIILADLVYGAASNLSKNPKIHPYVVTGLAITLLAFMLTKKVVNTVYFIQPPQKFANQYSSDKNIVYSWAWINSRLPKNTTLLSPSLMNTLYLNSFTSARPYLPAFLTTFMPTSEIEKRFIYANKLFGVPNDVFTERITMKTPYTFESVLDIYGYTYVNKIAFEKKYNYLNYSDLPLKNPDYPPVSRAAELIESYQNTNPNWPGIEAEYIYNSPLEKRFRGQADFNQDNFLQLVYRNPTVEIYKIKTSFLSGNDIQRTAKSQRE